MKPGLRLLLLIGAFLSAAIAPAPLWAGEAAANSVNQIMVMLPLPAPHFRVGTTYSDGYGEDAGRGRVRRVEVWITMRAPGRRTAVVGSEGKTATRPATRGAAATDGPRAGLERLAQQAPERARGLGTGT